MASTASFTTPALTAPATYYLEVTRNGCVNSVRSSVEVLIDNPVAPAVTPTPVNLCAGQTSTITVQAPVAGTTYNWYDTGGNLVFTGNVFTTPALNATTDYFVEGVIGNCSSPTRAQVTLNVSPLPAAPTVASSTVVIQSGQVVTLQVSNPVPQIAYDWYDVPTGGGALVTNSSSYTPSPALTADKTFYVAARNNSDCLSSVRTAIKVVVTPPAAITSCLRPFQQTISTNGLCIGCSAVLGTEGNSVDNDFDTATTLRNVVGVGAIYSKNLIFRILDLQEILLK